jgi:hypothetical protein
MSGAAPFNQAAFTTLFDRMHRVQTRMRRTPPFTRARTPLEVRLETGAP